MCECEPGFCEIGVSANRSRPQLQDLCTMCLCYQEQSAQGQLTGWLVFLVRAEPKKVQEAGG